MTVAIERKGPGRPCTICTHPDRDQIDDDIRCGRRYRNIAERFGLASHVNVFRHAQSHLAAVPAPREASHITDPKWLAQELSALYENLLRARDNFEQAKHITGWEKASTEMRKTMELIARVSGQLDARAETLEVSQAAIAHAVITAAVAVAFDRARAGEDLTAVQADLPVIARQVIEARSA